MSCTPSYYSSAQLQGSLLVLIGITSWTWDIALTQADRTWTCKLQDYQRLDHMHKQQKSKPWTQMFTTTEFPAAVFWWGCQVFFFAPNWNHVGKLKKSFKRITLMLMMIVTKWAWDGGTLKFDLVQNLRENSIYWSDFAAYFCRWALKLSCSSNLKIVIIPRNFSSCSLFISPKFQGDHWKSFICISHVLKVACVDIKIKRVLFSLHQCFQFHWELQISFSCQSQS